LLSILRCSLARSNTEYAGKYINGIKKYPAYLAAKPQGMSCRSGSALEESYI